MISQQTRTSIRFLVIGALSLVMLIPLLFVGSVAWDRQDYYNDAKASVASAWGGLQTVAGPFLVIDRTYRCQRGEQDGKPVWQTCITEQIYLPKTLNVSGVATHETRQRAIYDIPVYQAELKLTGEFDVPKPTNDFRLKLDTARLVVGITHTQALAKRPTLSAQGSPVDLQATTGESWLGSGVRADVQVTGGAVLAFEFDAHLKGTDMLSLSPIGDETKMSLESSWPHPSFSGRYLPIEHIITANGFTAQWSVHDLARALPSEWQAGSLNPSFGGASVTLFEPVTEHRLVDRGIKYGILFISLTFVTFLCFEISSNIRFHYVQYGVVGVGLCLFYLAVLSLSEHVAFGAAYVVATALIAGLISWYVGTITKVRKLAAYVGAIVAALYATLYVLLILEDYALLAGTGVLFLGLFALMYTTRSLNSAQAENAP